MTNEAKQIFLSIAPLFVEKGIELQERVAAAGGDPDKCTVGGKPIIEAYAASAKEWAETFAKAIDAQANQPVSLNGRGLCIGYTYDGQEAVSYCNIIDIKHGKGELVNLVLDGYETGFMMKQSEFVTLYIDGKVSVDGFELTLIND